jgi:hypothetical protein
VQTVVKASISTGESNSPVNFATAGKVDQGGDVRRRAAVSSEPVSGKFPASWENTGNFIDFGTGYPNLSSKQALQSIAYEQIPYSVLIVPYQGIKSTHQGVKALSVKPRPADVAPSPGQQLRQPPA